MAFGFNDAKEKVITMAQTAFSDAMNLKAPIESPEFTGTPKVPTAATTSNSTQVANTSFIKNVVNAIYPIGTILFLEESSPKPGIGTWTQVTTSHGGAVLMYTRTTTGGAELKIWKRTA